MANLSIPQALTLIKEPKNRKEIQKALRKKLRHKLHTEAVTEESDILDQSHQIFLEWVKSILKNDDTYARFLSLYRPPVSTNELVESIYSQFERVFESQNSFERFEFGDSETENDFNEYRKKLGDFSFWETQGFETLKSSIDNLLIVDLPSLEKDDQGALLQESDEPEPYYYFLDISNVIDVDSVKVKTIDTVTGKPFYYFKIEYVIFFETKDLVCVFDDGFYRTFRRIKDTENFEVLSETPHDLGYCPARSFWTTPLNASTKILKRAPITNSLSELDWYLAYSYFAKYLKLYAPFPIYAMYKGVCKFKDEVTKMRCVEGWLVRDGMKRGEHSDTRCPQCESKIKVGPGNIVEVSAPQESTDPDLLATTPIKVIPAEETSINAVNDELKNKWQSIYDNCVGKGGDPENKQAQNELQVQSGFESRTNVLIKIKRNFEIIHSFALETVARLRYGDKFKSLTIDYGDEFFVRDEKGEMDEYTAAKEQDLPGYDLSIRRNKINEARYRNNPELLERIKILNNLDPFPEMSVKQLFEVMKEQPKLLNPKDVYLKVNFGKMISRFERENISILTFGRKLDFDMKIDQMQSVLDSYVAAEMGAIPKLPDPVPSGSGAGNAA